MREGREGEGGGGGRRGDEGERGEGGERPWEGHNHQHIIAHKECVPRSSRA